MLGFSKIGRKIESTYVPQRFRFWTPLWNFFIGSLFTLKKSYLKNHSKKNKDKNSTDLQVLTPIRISSTGLLAFSDIKSITNLFAFLDVSFSL
jgi:hypothetical protein